MRYDHLLGIPYKEGWQTCWTLVRMFYKDNYNIILPSFVSPTEWPDHGMNLVHGRIKFTDFKLVPDVSKAVDLEVGDVPVFAIGSRVGCHCAIYIGDGKILHHLAGRLSEITACRGEYIQRLVFTIRHPLVRSMRQEETINYLDTLEVYERTRMEKIINAHKNRDV